MLRDLVGEDVQVVCDTLGVLRLLEVSGGARPELEARGQTLQSKHVFQREQRCDLGVVDHGRVVQATVVTRAGAPLMMRGTLTSAFSTLAATPSGRLAAPRR